MLLTASPPTADVALGVLETCPAPSVGPYVLPNNADLQGIVGDPLAQAIVNEPEMVLDAWRRACRTLSILQLGKLARTVEAVDLLAGLDGPYGEIRSFSNPGFPGFVALGIRNPDVILAEQAIHEAVHVVFSAHLALRDELSPLLDERAGALSPFTNSVRTIERVAHGILSYSAVHRLWAAVGGSAAAPSLLGIQDRFQCHDIIARRLKTLEQRLALATLHFCDAAGAEAFNVLCAVADDLLGLALAAPFRPGGDALVAEAAKQPFAPASLNAIERAEIALASVGMKASRITVRFADLPAVAFPLAAHCAVVPASWVVSPVPDPKLSGFSNLSGPASHVLDASSDSEVYLYLHQNPAIARQAAILDLTDEAGELLGIPACCRRWFQQNWPVAKSYGGDAFALMLRQAAKVGEVHMVPECDASAMYRGGGLCWHFPCSPVCTETVALVTQRRVYLQGSNPLLLAELEAAYRRTFSLLEQGGYVDGVCADQGAVVVRIV